MKSLLGHFLLPLPRHSEPIHGPFTAHSRPIRRHMHTSTHEHHHTHLSPLVVLPGRLAALVWTYLGALTFVLVALANWSQKWPLKSALFSPKLQPVLLRSSFPLLPPFCPSFSPENTHNCSPKCSQSRAAPEHRRLSLLLANAARCPRLHSASSQSSFHPKAIGRAQLFAGGPAFRRVAGQMTIMRTNKNWPRKQQQQQQQSQFIAAVSNLLQRCNRATAPGQQSTLSTDRSSIMCAKMAPQ